MNHVTENEVSFSGQVRLATLHTRLLFTHDGYIGTAPIETRKGNEKRLLLGYRVPVLLHGCRGGNPRVLGEVSMRRIIDGRAKIKNNEERLQFFGIHQLGFFTHILPFTQGSPYWPLSHGPQISRVGAG